METMTREQFNLQRRKKNEEIAARVMKRAKAVQEIPTEEPTEAPAGKVKRDFRSDAARRRQVAGTRQQETIINDGPDDIPEFEPVDEVPKKVIRKRSPRKKKVVAPPPKIRLTRSEMKEIAILWSLPIIALSTIIIAIVEVLHV